MNQTMRRWIDRAQKGEEEAVLMILQQFRPLIYKYACRYQYCYDSLDEAISVAQLAMLECIHAFDMSGSEEVHKAFRRAVDRVFKRDSRRFRTYAEIIEHMLHVDEVIEALGISGGDEQDPQRRAVAAELQENVRQCLAHLTEKERQFLHLRYHADLTYADIARRCGLSLSQTHKLTQAAMAKFCDIMHRYDIHPLNGEEA